MIRADRLRKVFPEGDVAVEEATFEVAPREILALLGANGAGKTTTLHMLLGLLPPSGGRALIGGVDVHEHPLEVYARVGYVSENVLLYGPLTARQNLRFFGRVSGARIPEANLSALLDRVGLASAADRRVQTFSKGMRQRLGLAVALVKDPPALILDEPTSGLDPEGVDDLLRLLRELGDAGKAILMSTHDLHRVHEIADRMAVMAGGRVRAVASRDEVGEDVLSYYRRLSAEGAA